MWENMARWITRNVIYICIFAVVHYRHLCQSLVNQFLRTFAYLSKCKISLLHFPGETSLSTFKWESIEWPCISHRTIRDPHWEWMEIWCICTPRIIWLFVYRKRKPTVIPCHDCQSLSSEITWFIKERHEWRCNIVLPCLGYYHFQGRHKQWYLCHQNNFNIQMVVNSSTKKLYPGVNSF